MECKRTILTFVLLFAAVYYVARIAIFVAGVTGSMEFEEEQIALVENFVLMSFIAIGVAGLILLPGIRLHKPWAEMMSLLRMPSGQLDCAPLRPI